ncbi:MAG: ECF transporter S component [Ruminococcaceae bacterium]|nr:ECF transporter S component [Oscillospiraceae bacterium]
MSSKKISIKKIVYAAILIAIAEILMLFEFFILPSYNFLKFDFSNVAVMVGGYILGPVYAIIILIGKCLLHIPLGKSGPIGELADFITGLFFILPMCIIYLKKKTQLWTIIGLAIGIVLLIPTALFANKFILLPVYMPAMTEAAAFKAYALGGLIPFNFLKGVIISVVYFSVIKIIKRVNIIKAIS